MNFKRKLSGSAKNQTSFSLFFHFGKSEILLKSKIFLKSNVFKSNLWYKILVFWQRIYLTSRFMGDICKCKQFIWTLHTSFHKHFFSIFKSLCQGHQSPKHSWVKDYFIAPIMQCAIPRHAIAAKGKWQYIRRPTTADFFLQVDLPAGLVGKVAFISKPRLSS